MRMTTGYIIQSDNNSYLTASGFWFVHDNITEAYVFSQDEIDGIRVISKDWEFKPRYLVPAIYNPETGLVSIVGSRQEFDQNDRGKESGSRDPRRK